ncbi:MAG: hypothetical protein ACYDHZ_03130 [Dehalococcoidia bacterium]
MAEKQSKIDRQGMRPAQAGHLGGVRTACEYGINRFICPVDGNICPRRIDEKSEFYTQNGRRGGKIGAKVIAQKYGSDYRVHMSNIGAMGGRGNTREKRLNKLNADSNRSENAGGAK